MTRLRMILIAGLIAAPLLLLQWQRSAISLGDDLARAAEPPPNGARPHLIASLAQNP